MCGIFGIALRDGLEFDAPTRAGMIEASRQLRHRGPDQSGFEVFQNVFLGHERLSILDLSEAGHQPMVSPDGQVAILVNGEIYNHKALRKKLGEDRFRSHCDSEVILHGYQEWGLEKLLSELDGMYAFSILDRSVRKIFLARDRAGIKPLYYARLDNHFCFASELKAIEHFARGRSSLHLDKAALFDYLTYRYIPSPKTIYKEVSKLKPAEFLAYDIPSSGISRQAYWSLNLEDSLEAPARNNDEIEELIQAEFANSVSEQLASDVPVGCFLSGGIDSTLLYSHAIEHDRNLPALSVGFSAGTDELDAAQQTVAKLGGHLIKGIITPEHLEDAVARMKSWFDEPFGDLSAIPTYTLCQFAKQHCTVALSGDGGDELFGGYRWYAQQPSFDRLNSLFPGRLGKGSRQGWVVGPKGRFSKIAAGLQMLTYRDNLERYSLLMGNIPPRFKQKYRDTLEIDKDYDDIWFFRDHYKVSLEPVARLRYLDFHTFLPENCLTKIDRMSMRNSLEVRVPFLSKELIERSFTLDDAFILNRGRLKGGLIKTFENRLPKHVIDARKRGFALPQALTKDTVAETYAFRFSSVDKVIENYQT